MDFKKKKCSSSEENKTGLARFGSGLAGLTSVANPEKNPLHPVEGRQVSINSRIKHLLEINSSWGLLLAATLKNAPANASGQRDGV